MQNQGVAGTRPAPRVSKECTQVASLHSGQSRRSVCRAFDHQESGVIYGPSHSVPVEGGKVREFPAVYSTRTEHAFTEEGLSVIYEPSTSPGPPTAQTFLLKECKTLSFSGWSERAGVAHATKARVLPRFTGPTPWRAMRCTCVHAVLCRLCFSIGVESDADETTEGKCGFLSHLPYTLWLYMEFNVMNIFIFAFKQVRLGHLSFLMQRSLRKFKVQTDYHPLPSLYELSIWSSKAFCLGPGDDHVYQHGFSLLLLHK